MSHESGEFGRPVLYTASSRFSDVLRIREFDQFFGEYDGKCFSVQTVDGWSWSSSPRRVPQFTATFRTLSALDAVIEGASETKLGRLFLNGSIELEGSIPVLLSVAQYTLSHSDGLSHGIVQTISRLSHDISRKLIPVHRIPGNQNWHYAPCPLDLPVAFFEPWLGSPLGHSCISVANGVDEFESAQRKSLEEACQLLELTPADRLLDVGCGWGSLLVHGAEHHGAYTQGIASSEMQKAAASERIDRRSLHRLSMVECCDLHSKRGGGSPKFTKAAHLGIFEQVGSSDWAEYLSCLHDLIMPRGLLLLHRVTRSPGVEACMTLLPPDFLSDGISRELHVAENAGFDLLRAEDLQTEYQETIRVWIERLSNAHRSEATGGFSSGFRAWMLYLIELATSLNAEDTHVHSLLLRRRG